MTRTAAQILDTRRIYTAAMCCDASDARYALETLTAECSAAELMMPAVSRRYFSLRKVLAKFDPTAFEAPSLTSK